MSEDGVDQPPIEQVVYAPLQVRDRGDETVVGYLSRTGFRVLKRY